MAEETKRTGTGLGLLNGRQAPGDFWGGLAAMLVVLPASDCLRRHRIFGHRPDLCGLRRHCRHRWRNRDRPRRRDTGWHRPPDQRAVRPGSSRTGSLCDRARPSGRRLVGDRAADDHVRGHRRPHPDPARFRRHRAPDPLHSIPSSAAISAVGLIIIGSQIPASSVPP